jgi:hypothetical protein
MSTSLPPPASAPPLEYGHELVAGGVNVVDQPDGSVHVIVPPRPWWQPALLGVVALVVPFVVPAFLYFKAPSLIGVLLPLCYLPVFLMLMSIVLHWARQDVRIAAGPDGVHVWYTESGDKQTMSMTRDEIKDVRAGKNELLFLTARGSRALTMYHGRRNLEHAAAAVRRGAGIDGRKGP